MTEQTAAVKKLKELRHQREWALRSGDPQQIAEADAALAAAAKPAAAKEAAHVPAAKDQKD